MPSRKIPLFAHRHNPDGSWDTICSSCVATVARERIEANLAPTSSPTCDPVRIQLFATELTRKDR